MTAFQSAAVHPRARYLQSIVQPISRAPSLARFNGFGTTLLGEFRDPHLEPSYVAVQFFTVVFIPLLPLGFFVVESAGGDSFYFTGRIRYADLRVYARPEGMRQLRLSLLRHPTVWIGLAFVAYFLFGGFLALTS